MQTSDAAELMTTGEVAHAANVSREMVIRWTVAGKLTAERTGHGQRLFKRADVERFLAERAEAAK